MQDKQQKIFNSAQQMFKEYGFKGTNIVKITQHAGVATGTFYRFYNSKEEIFIQVYAAENDRVKQTVLNDNDLDEEPRTLLPKVIHQLMAQMNASLILQAWYTNPKLKQLIKDNSSMQDDFMYHTVFQLIKHWQTRNLLRPEMTMARVQQLFEALVVVNNHQEELPTGDYKQLFTDLIEGVLDHILK